MNDSVVCPACGHKNTLQANQCVNCGVTLHSNTTLASSPEALNIQRPEIDLDSGIEEDVIYFYVAGAKQSNALVHHGQTSAILGRQTDNPDGDHIIDFSDFQAFALGVSRRHARIIYTDDGYTIEDLNSSNGTWINGNRLEPEQPVRLHRGDHIQLGELMMFVYFFHNNQ